MHPSPYRGSSAPLSHAAAIRAPLRRLAWRTYRRGVNLPLAIFCAVCAALVFFLLEPPWWFAWGHALLMAFSGVAMPFARGVKKWRAARKAHELRAARARFIRLSPSQRDVFAAVVAREEKRRGTLMTAEELAKRLAAFGVAGADCEKVLAMMGRIAQASGAPVVPKAPPNITIWK